MKTLRKSLMIVLIALFSLCTLTAFGLSKTAKADGTVFAMDYGAYARVKVSAEDYGGLRFRVKFSADVKEGLDGDDELGFAVMTKAFYDGIGDKANFEYATATGDGVWQVPADKSKIYQGKDAEEDAEYYFANCLIKAGEEYYGTEFFAIAYVDGEDYTYATYTAGQNTKSLYNVINSAALDGYLDDMADTYSWFGTANYPVNINADNYENAVSVKDALSSKSFFVAFAGDVVDSEGLKSEFSDKAVNLVSSSNIADLLTATSGTYMLTEDIDMATAYTANGGVWTSTAEFAGTFNGAGHKIKNLKTSGSGLFKCFNGTIKDVAFLDAVQNSNGTGIIAIDYKRTGLAVTVENVVANFKTANTGWESGGLFDGLNISSKVTFKNVFVNVNTTSNGGDGLIAFKISGPVTLDNCCFIGFQEKLDYGYYSSWVASYKGTDGEDAVKGEDYYTYADLMTFIEDGYSAFKPSAFVKGVIDEIVGASVTLINSANIADLLTATSGVYMLTEDIDMATAYTDNDGVWAPSATFSGTLNGAGHTISNLNIAGGKGLFGTLSGTVKNLALTNVTTTNQGGVICYSVGGNAAKAENVVIHIKSVPNSYRVGVIGRVNSASITAKDLVVISDEPSNTIGYIGFDAYFNPPLENCYFVGKCKIIGEIWAGTPAATGTYKEYADIDGFATEYEKTESEINLTDFGKSVVDEILKKNA